MKTKTVLVVEDNELNLKLVRDLLEVCKYRVLEASDAETGYKLVQKHLPDLILMDIQLPGIDGLSATKMIKADPALKDIPVIALTAYAMRGDEDKVLQAGCDGYLAKPIDTHKFTEYVNRFLGSNQTDGKRKQTRNKNKILIVDDEPLNIKLLEAILSTDSYEIVRAYDGEQALKKVNEQLPDLILLDIMMPGIDGFEITRRLKAHRETRDIPIILITAYDVADFKVIGHEAGADEFLNKPVKAAELQSRVKSLLRIKECQDQLKLQSRAETSEGCDSEEKAFQDEDDGSSVLLLLEEESDAKLIQMYLHGQPWQIMIERSAEAAVARCQERRIDLILLDVMLQGKESFQICSRLKETEQTQNVQILVITSSENLESKHRQFELWSDDFLIKPVNVHELRARVKSLLKKKTYLDRLYAGSEGSVRAAITDSLSGLANYAYFEYFLEHEIKRSLRDGKPVALIIMDLADVKQHPHSPDLPAAEGLLNGLGALIKGNIREVDLGARCKEKKFAVVLPNTDLNGAKMVAERIGYLIQNKYCANPEKGSGASLSLPIGIGVYPTDADSRDGLIRQAEKALLESASKCEHLVDSA